MNNEWQGIYLFWLFWPISSGSFAWPSVISEIPPLFKNQSLRLYVPFTLNFAVARVTDKKKTNDFIIYSIVLIL